MGIVLWPLAKLFEAGAKTRAWMYASGRVQQQRLDRPVVSIGNLSVGGTGKTPLTIWLFQELKERGLRPAVLTRGYRRPAGRPTLILHDPTSQDAGLAGDEVQVMLRHGVGPIGVDVNRYRAGRILEREYSPDLFILDDGFQHLEMARDLDVVLVDSSRPVWEDRVLPAGLLREPVEALARAQFVVITRVREWTDFDLAHAHVKLAAPRAHVLGARTCLELGPLPAHTHGKRGAITFAFAGIGNPKAFFADLCLAGVKVVGTRNFRDHHRYTHRDLIDIERRAAAAHANELVTTEKDAVKIGPELRAALNMPLRVAGMRLDVDKGGALVEAAERLITPGAQQSKQARDD